MKKGMAVLGIMLLLLALVGSVSTARARMLAFMPAPRGLAPSGRLASPHPLPPVLSALDIL